MTTLPPRPWHWKFHKDGEIESLVGPQDEPVLWGSLADGWGGVELNAEDGAQTFILNACNTYSDPVVVPDELLTREEELTIVDGGGFACDAAEGAIKRHVAARCKDLIEALEGWTAEKMEHFDDPEPPNNYWLIRAREAIKQAKERSE